MSEGTKGKKCHKLRLSILFLILSCILFFSAGFYYFYFYEPLRPFNIDNSLDRALWNHDCPFNYAGKWSQASGKVEIDFRTALSDNLMRRGDNYVILEEKYIAVLIAAESAYNQQLMLSPPNCLAKLHVYTLALYSTYADACKSALSGDYKIGQQYEALLPEIQENIKQEQLFLQGYFESLGY